MKIWRRPALLTGESSRVSRHYGSVSGQSFYVFVSFLRIVSFAEVALDSDDPGDVESYLVSDIGASFADITVHLAHDADVLIAVQQRELLILGATTATGDSLVGFQTGIGEHHDQALGVLVMRRNGHMLLRDELRELRRRTRLGPCR